MCKLIGVGLIRFQGIESIFFEWLVYKAENVKIENENQWDDDSFGNEYAVSRLRVMLGEYDDVYGLSFAWNGLVSQ